MSKKLYAVNVTCDFDMYVIATDERDAAKVARRHAREEVEQYHGFDVGIGTEVTSSAAGDEDVIPWGDPSDDAHKDWSVSQYVKERDEAEEQRRVDANQLKLFPVEGA